MNERKNWVDTAKAIGIFCIVLGHTLQDRNGMFRQFLFAFHVPLFFFLSGVTYRCYGKFSEFVVKRAKSILVPYVLFSLISIAIYQVMSKFISLGEISSTMDCIKEMIYANA